MTTLLIAALTLLLAQAAPVAVAPIGAKLAPARAAAGLTMLALTVALVTGFVLCAAAGLAAVQLWTGLWPDDWSARIIGDLVPLPPLVGVASGVLAAAMLIAGSANLATLTLRSSRASRTARAIPSVDGLAIVNHDDVHAYAVPGRRARVIVSTGALRRLTAPERRALLAHERAHLRHRHHVYARLAHLAAAVDPFVRPAARAVDVALERWADEDAAGEVGDRAVVARALAAAAGTRGPRGPRGPRTALGAAENAVLTRVRALLAPVPPRRGAAGVLLVLLVLCWTAALAVLLQVYGAIEVSEAVR